MGGAILLDAGASIACRPHAMVGLLGNCTGMASEREAACALEANAKHLRALGAHTVSVDTVGRGRRKTYGVVAIFDRLPSVIPKTLDVTVSGKAIAVLLVATVAGKRE